MIVFAGDSAILICFGDKGMREPHGEVLWLGHSLVALSPSGGTGRVGLGLSVNVPEHHF